MSQRPASMSVCFSTLGDKLISQVLSGMRGHVWKMLVSGTFFPRCITKGFEIQRFSPHLSYAQLARRRDGEPPNEDQGLRSRFCLSSSHRNEGERLGFGTIDLMRHTFVPMHIHFGSPAGTARARGEACPHPIVIRGCFSSSCCVVLVPFPHTVVLTSVY